MVEWRLVVYAAPRCQWAAFEGDRKSSWNNKRDSVLLLFPNKFRREVAFAEILDGAMSESEARFRP